jgi:hypothetical protein
MEETASGNGGQLRIYWISSSGQSTKGGPPAGGGLLQNITKGLGSGRIL